MKLLVVDDDRYAREGILSSLPLEELGIRNVMQTHDGKTALEIVRWFSPDIIITDICMPRMDGLAFAAAVKKMQPECKLIFITGFAEISYLKQAIELSAVAFVEKPLQPDELLRAVQTAIQRFQEGQNLHQRTENLRKLQRQQLASLMMRTNKDMDELHRLCDKVRYPSCAAYRCLALRTGQQDAYEVMTLLESEATAQHFHCLMELREEKQIHVLLGGKKQQVTRVEAFVSDLLQKLPGIIIGEGNTVFSLEQVHESRKTACRMLEGAFYDQTCRYFPYQARVRAATILSMDTYANFSRLLEEDIERLPEWLDDLLDQITAAASDRVETVKSLMVFILRELYQRYPELYGKVYGISQPHELEEFVLSVTCVQQYKEMLVVLFDALQALQASNTRFGQIVRDAKAFIVQHIHESDLGLKEIAANVNFSAAYLNVVFRAETGMTVKQYLIECRLKEAKHLLRNPNVRISEIAERCGYSNPNYFTKAFKEATGITPGEYRERRL